MSNGKYVLVVGDPFNGLSHFGTFDTFDAGNLFGETYFPNETFWVKQLVTEAEWEAEQDQPEWDVDKAMSDTNDSGALPSE